MATPSPVAAQHRHDNGSTGGAWSGWIMFAACTAAVFMAGARILDSLRHEREAGLATQT